MSLLALMLPLSVHSGHGPATYASPGDDQPWGGEIDGRDLGDNRSAFNSVADDSPSSFYLPAFEFIGTPLVIFDLFHFDFYTTPTVSESSCQTRYIKKEEILFSPEFEAPLIRHERLSIKRGR
jgi:hypothetical protein